MAYTPIDPLGLEHGLAANATVYQTLWGNHNEMYENDGSYPILDRTFNETISAGLTDSKLFTWRVRGNLDLNVIRTRVYAESTAGTTTVYVKCGGVSSSASVTAAGWYEINVTPPVSGVATLEMSVTTPGGVTFTLSRWQCRLVGSSPGTRLASGGARLDSVGMYAANEPINSEHVGRMLAFPVYTARSHMRCVSSHVSRLALTGGAKAIPRWQGYDSTSWETIGFLTIPRVSTRARPYVLDAFTMETTTDGSSVDIVIGGVEWRLRNLGGTSGTWHTTELELGPGPHEVRVSGLPGSSNYVRVASFQAWRGRVTYP